MARRRNLSTEISDDRELNAIAQMDDFAALLYTWSIPHAGDDRSLPGDPEDLLYLVMPRRRDRTPEDVERAVRAWVNAGLVDWVWVGRKRTIYLKEGSFYRYQDKIPTHRRFLGLPEGAVPVTRNDEPPREPKDPQPEEPLTPKVAAELPQTAAPAAESPPLRFRDSSPLLSPLASLPAVAPGTDPPVTPSAYGAASPADDGPAAAPGVDAAEQPEPVPVEAIPEVAKRAYDDAREAGWQPTDGRWVGQAIGRMKRLTPQARALVPLAAAWAASPGSPGHVATWLGRCELVPLVDAWRRRNDNPAAQPRASPSGRQAAGSTLREARLELERDLAGGGRGPGP